MRSIRYATAAVLAIALAAAGCGESRQETYEKAMRAADAARSTLDAAQKEYGKREKATEKARSEVAEAEAALATARKKLDAANQGFESARAEVAKWSDDTSMSRLLQQRLLADKALEKAAVAGRVENGVALLEGTVPDATAGERAAAIARDTPGVVDVQSRLSVPTARAAVPAAEAPVAEAPAAAPPETPPTEAVPIEEPH